MNKYLKGKLSTLAILVTGMSGYSVAADVESLGRCEFSHSGKTGIWHVVPSITKSDCLSYVPPPHNHFNQILSRDDILTIISTKDSDLIAHTHGQEKYANKPEAHTHSHSHLDKPARPSRTVKLVKKPVPPTILSMHQIDWVDYDD